ncbi:LysR substrate-binding domain-containing protein [Limnobacter sp.]|uniref:LysR substrate-binding domain-containing protein n=1 Tax=Limnobacter sp. TaxID=2003368 RepID=UPI00351239CB
METKWLEDFITLAQTKNFSKAASLRFVTQPAFSRRIQALEAWLGCELIDRGSYPTRLSPQGEVFYEQAITMLGQIRQARTIVRGGSMQSKQPVRLVVPHTLACSKMPNWLSQVRTRLEGRVNELSFQLTASNVHDAVLHFTDGACDFLICYHHSREPIELDPSRFEVRTLGLERFAPFALAGEHGQTIFQLDPLAPLPVPLLSYSKHAYLSKMTDIALEGGPAFLKKTVYETDMSESLKSMCEAGMGVAWLPESAVGDESVLRQVPGPYFTEMEVRMYRRAQRGRDALVGPDQADLVWHYWPD